MNDFLIAGFNLHIMKDILDNLKTNYFWMDSIITIGAVMCFNNKHSLIKYCNPRKLYEHLTNIFTKKIEYRLSSVRKANYESSFNTCHVNLCSVCYYCIKQIENNPDIDTSKIRFCEEFISDSSGDGYSEDNSLIVPIGKLYFKEKGICVETYLQNKEQEEKHGKKTEYKQIEISIFSKTHTQIQKFLKECIKKYNHDLNLISNEEIKWFRLRDINKHEGPRYFSKKLEHKATFDNLFFDNKDKLLKMLNDLNNGERDKICLLLHGPPGSGKDSIIVAISKYLSQLNKKRHIIAYPLDLFSSADDLMRVWHGTDKIDGYNIPNDQQLRICPEMEKYNPELVCNNSIKEIVKEKTKPEEANEEVFELIQKNSDVELSKDSFELVSMIKNMQGNMTKNVPKLKLAPIIELTDSFMNQKGTIVIFTTNLPLECINEVLIRHERLDKFYVGPSSKQHICQIMNLYFNNKICVSDLSELPSKKLMPSDVHYYCKISNSSDECIKLLKDHA
jgi:hypothetical protein